MGTYSEIKEIYNDIKNDKIMLYIFRILSGLITFAVAFSIFIFIHHAVKEKPAKLLFGLAEINTVKIDTIYKIIPLKKDTITLYKKSIKYLPKANFGYENRIKNLVKKTDTISKNQTSSSGSNAHIINGNGNSVGVNGDVNNGIKQRHFNDAEMLNIQITLKAMFSNHKEWNSKIPISIGVPNDEESKIYALELRQNLIKIGYENFKFPGVISGGFINKNFDITTSPFDGYPMIVINPAKNISK